MSEPIFGKVPPSGACKVRIKTKFARTGGTPVIVCAELTQDGVQEAIDACASLAKYIKAYEKELRLGKKAPYSLKGEMCFLGSDGGDIDAPTEIEFEYFGAGKKKKKNKKDRLAIEALRCQRDMFCAREQSRQVEIKELGETFRAASTHEPNNELISELRAVRAAESGRADAANKDVHILLKGGQGVKKTTLDQVQQVFGLWSTAKDVVGTLKNLKN